MIEWAIGLCAVALAAAAGWLARSRADRPKPAAKCPLVAAHMARTYTRGPHTIVRVDYGEGLQNRKETK